MADAPGRARIDFLGIGAQKAATSWLHRELALHPEVRFPGGKEVHFWDRRAGRPASEWLALFEKPPPGAVQGEITPAYALLDEATVREVAALAPGLRVLFCLRNPMERAWSAALMALERAELCLEEASDAWFVDHFRSRGSLARGDYETTLRRWRAVFGAERVALLWWERIRRDPRGVMEDVARHLGVDPGFYAARPEAELARPAFAGRGAPVRASLRPVLRELYAGRVASLEAYLGVDLSHWRRFEDEEPA